jgi:hypothetical protein
MNKQIGLSLGTTLLLGLGGCASYPLVPTKLIVDFDNSKAGTLYAMKNSAGLENCMNNRNNPNGYSIYGGHCTFQPKDVPEKVVIEYARFMSSQESKKFYGKGPVTNASGVKTYYGADGQAYSDRISYSEAGNKKQGQAIAQLPPSAWRTFTIYPKQLLKKYQGVTPEYGSAITSSFAKKLVYQLIMQPDSTIKTEETYSYESSGEGWRN